MRNVRKLGKLINEIDSLKMECRDPILAATSDPDYEQTIIPLQEKLKILSGHLAELERELISVLPDC